MKDNLNTSSLYSEYCELSMSNNSKPIMFCDIFGNNIKPNSIKISKSTSVLFNYSSRVRVKNVNVTGTGSLRLFVGFSAVLENLDIHISKGDLTIFIGPFSEIKNLNIQSFDFGNYLHYGAGNTLNTGSLVLQGINTGIFFGHDCMFSSRFHARTSDSHSIFSYDSRRRINSDKSIAVGDHVWIGREVILNKGAKISDDVIVGQGSIVSGLLKSSSCYAGIPALCLKSGVTWERDRKELLDDINKTYHYRPRQLAVNKFLKLDEPFHPRPSSEHLDVRRDHFVHKEYPWIPHIFLS